MKNTQLTTCPKIVKWAFVVFNIFLGALGIVLFALGVRVVTVTASVPPQSVAGQDSLLTMLVIAGGVLHFICGIVIFALAVVGVLGAVIQARLLLVIYATMLSAITVIQFIGVIVPLVALSPSANLTPILSSLLTQFIRGYTLPPANAGQNDFIDNIQNTSSCCGVNNATDWMESPLFIDRGILPPSCCSFLFGSDCMLNSTNIHESGCITRIGAFGNIDFFVDVGAAALVIIAFVVLLGELLGIALSASLTYFIHSAKQYIV